MVAVYSSGSVRALENCDATDRPFNGGRTWRTSAWAAFFLASIGTALPT
jgi:hypothetical protein